MIGKSNSTSRDVCEVVMQTAEPVSTIEATERLVNILNITYANAYLKQVDNNEI